MDHVQQLGPTIEGIAWHKAGISKRGTYAFSSPQEHPAAQILRDRAAEKGVRLQFAENDPSFPADAPQLKPDVQRMNCSIALATARYFLEEKSFKRYSAAILLGYLTGYKPILLTRTLSTCWRRSIHLVPGWYTQRNERYQGRRMVRRELCGKEVLQPQHTLPPIINIRSASPVQILIFSQVSKQRDTKLVLERLATALSPIRIDHVIFTSYDAKQDFDPTTREAT